MWLQQREAEPLHPGPALQAIDESATLGLVEGKVAQNREPVGMLARGLDSECVRVGVPAGWMDDGRVHAALVHLPQDVGGREVGHLTMARVPGRVVSPDVNLRVYDQHAVLLSLDSASLAEGPMVFKGAIPSAPAPSLGGEPLRRRRHVRVARPQVVVRHQREVGAREPAKLGDGLRMQIDPQIDHRVRLAVDDVEAAGDLAVGLAARRLARLERSEQTLPECEIGAPLEDVEHGVGDVLADDGVGRDHHVAVGAMAGPRLVLAARSRGGEPGHVEASELAALHELIARRDLLQGTRRRVAGAHQIQAQIAQTRTGAGLGDDRADPRCHVDAARADRHLAGGDGDAEHSGALASADERERRELDADHEGPPRRDCIIRPLQMKFVGVPIKRLEDPRLLVGGGRFVDDVVRPGMVHAVFVRSPHPHARVRGVDVRRALALPGVLACVTGAELAGVPTIPLRQGARPEHAAFLQPPLARETVRYAGEPVAVVIAGDRATAVDARDLVEIDYEVLPALVDPADAERPGGPVLFTGGNVVDSWTTALGDSDAALREAACVVRERFAIGRQTAAPMETRGLVAEWDRAAGRLTVWGTTKVP